MKYLHLVLFIIVAQLSFTQQRNVEELLNRSEQDLFQLEQNIVDLERTLKEQGLSTKDNFQYQELQLKYKSKKAEVKALRKEYKQLKRLRKKQSSRSTQVQPNAQVPYQQPTANPQVNQNPAINEKKLFRQAQKERKNQLKDLKSQRKQLINEQKNLIEQLVANQINPMTDNRVQEYDKRILEITDKMTYLDTKPITIEAQNRQSNSMQIIQEAADKAVVPYNNEPPRTNSDKPSTISQQVEQYQEQQENYSNTNSFTTEEYNYAANEPIRIPEIGLTTILFPKYVTEVPQEYELYLNFVAKQLQQNPYLKLQIESYTDDSDKIKVSMNLTTEMANSTVQEFVNRGIDPNRLLVKANGSKRPLGDNGNFFGQARNRRVELSFYAQ